MSNTSILDGFIESFTSALTPEVAARLVHFRADPKTQARLDELAEKSNEGQLTPAEREEYERYVSAIDFISVLQAKARMLLKRQAG